ncbi:polyprenyl synthetase family protein [Kitasatospora sp. NPDC002551]|uniref:polyprenyl synthetase family protein n=1 Tax=Kitasatospora sp. NPDC002551 TaxID=3154539 RepID=UPI003326DA6A
MAAPPAPLPSELDDGSDLRSLLERVEEGLTAFLARERGRQEAVTPHEADPARAVAELVRSGGKRIRPRFLLSGYLAAGGTPGERPVRAAMALELLHTAALLHDDVMDDAALRRSVRTAHTWHADLHRARGWRGEPRRYGESMAVLAGDLAWAYADHLMADLSPEVSREWFELKTELIAGQAMDVAASAAALADAELARRIAVLKSGRYTVHRPLVLGALLAGRADLASGFAGYGDALGEAFQLRDDLIDAFGDPEAAGKPTGADARAGRTTLLTALAVRREPRSPGWVSAARTAPPDRGRAGATAHAAVEARIAALLARARQCLADAPLSPEWRRRLAVTAAAAVYRDR